MEAGGGLLGHFSSPKRWTSQLLGRLLVRLTATQLECLALPNSPMLKPLTENNASTVYAATSIIPPSETLPWASDARAHLKPRFTMTSGPDARPSPKGPALGNLDGWGLEKTRPSWP